MLRLEPRRELSRLMQGAAPVLAVVLTLVVAGLAFTLLGYQGLAAMRSLFIAPLIEPMRWPDLLVKASPLVLIALGLSFGFRAGVWNIGAEGQYVMGAIAATGIALLTTEIERIWVLPAMMLAGMAGGAAYAALPAVLRARLQVSEILTSLMLTYVAIQLLYYLTRGPWKDPQGFNFPQTVMFSPHQVLPPVAEGSLIHWGIPITALLVLLAGLVMSRSLYGYEVRLVGLAPAAARYGGFSQTRTILSTLLLGGAAAGLAGAFEVAGPFGQLVPQFPTNYGFTAIIVAFLGRLNPFGMMLAGLVLAITYVGGELAQTAVGLPQAATGMFQAMLLFFLLAVDVLVRYRLVWRRPVRRSA